MKKILLIFILLLITNTNYAIDWINLKSEAGNMFALDKDSITEKDGHYFYNLKVYTNGLDDVVVTMQSKTNRPFCTRIEHYKLAQYESLNGNYSNITKNMTKKL